MPKSFEKTPLLVIVDHPAGFPQAVSRRVGYAHGLFRLLFAGK
jgi:hypothetical protein